MPACDLHVTALAVAVRENPGYRRLTDGDEDLPVLQATAALRGVPPDRLAVREGRDPDDDVCTRALRALGAPDAGQQLYLVHAGSGPDPHIAFLAKLVQESGWTGEATGITHMDEAAGTAIFDLLDWAADSDGGATVLIADEPLIADSPPGTDAPDGPRQVSAAAVRVRRGAGPLRVLGAGEGAPTAQAGTAGHQFGGTGPCDGWLAFSQAAREGRLVKGDRVLIRADGARRRGWVLLEVTSAQPLCPAAGGPAAIPDMAARDLPR